MKPVDRFTKAQLKRLEKKCLKYRPTGKFVWEFKPTDKIRKIKGYSLDIPATNPRDEWKNPYD